MIRKTVKTMLRVESTGLGDENVTDYILTRSNITYNIHVWQTLLLILIVTYHQLYRWDILSVQFWVVKYTDFFW